MHAPEDKTAANPPDSGFAVFYWRARRALIVLAVASMSSLAGLSVMAAVAGEEQAAWLMNSWPVVFLWLIVGLGLLAAGLWPGLVRRKPWVAAAHLGGAVILGGALWGSPQLARLTGRTPLEGMLIIGQGSADNRLARRTDEGGLEVLGELSFNVHLDRFEIQYPSPGPSLDLMFTRQTSSSQGPAWQKTPVVAPVGKTVDLADDLKLLVLEELTTPLAGDQANPHLRRKTLRLVVTRGETSQRLVFTSSERNLADYGYDILPLRSCYADDDAYRAAGEPALLLVEAAPPPIQYVSHVRVMRQGKQIASGDISVNNPLHVDGYHIYQADYEPRYWRYAVLKVVPDRGVWIVFVGFAMLAGGLAGHCWVRPFVRALRKGRRT